MLLHQSNITLILHNENKYHEYLTLFTHNVTKGSNKRI